MSRVELNIIIPTLNEEEALRNALESLARQREIEFEVIIADGGSTDLTRLVATGHDLQRISFFLAGSGKAQQLNAGAALATGEYLLFMHADSSFPDELALRKGVDTLREAEARGNKRFAGHFQLKFDRNSPAPSLGYTYYERKARLNRPGCSHGDQGIMLSRELFAESGPFSDACPLLAETRFADQLRKRGEWLLIPADILTSARRFEKEGLKERQTLNAIIMALGAIGQDQLINGMPHLYSAQNHSERTEIYPVLMLVRAKITALSRGERRRFWLRIGEYVRDNAWQLPFFLDVRREFRANGIVENNSLYWLDRFDRCWNILISNVLGTCCAGLLVRIWFRSLLHKREKRRQPTTWSWRV